MIDAYAPTSRAEDEKVEQFHDDIERARAYSDSKYKIITGDFTAKIETKTKEETFKSKGAFGIGERNERGDCLIDFAEKHKLIITNLLFRSPPPSPPKKATTTTTTNKQTRKRMLDFGSPDGTPPPQKKKTTTKNKKPNKQTNKTKQNKTNKQTNKQNNNNKRTNKQKTKQNKNNNNKRHTNKTNKKDFALSNQRGIVTNCEVITKSDTGTDHILVRMALGIKKNH